MILCCGSDSSRGAGRSLHMFARYVDVALRLATPEPLQFEIPEHLRGKLLPGQRVQVPLRAKQDVGYVVGLSDSPKVPGIRPVIKALDAVPQLPGDLLQLILWIAEHYLAPVGLVFRAAVPRPVFYEGTGRGTVRERRLVHATLSLPLDEVERLLPELARRAPAQAEALATLRLHHGKAVPAASLNRAAIDGLEKKGWIRLAREEVTRGVLPPLAETARQPPLTAAQAEVFARILPALAGGAGAPFLLHGVTGSGKTEVYLRAMRALPPDRQALLLVPEISLTVQLIRHLRERLPGFLAVWHHQLSDGEKYDLWRALQRGEVRVVVGTRSALFAPFPRLGLIVVDEEQEPSYKQEETPCYNAREAARARARFCGAAMILGTATPSLESRHFAERGEYLLLRLPERYTGLPLPVVELIDLRESPPPTTRRGPQPVTLQLITPRLLDAARTALDAGDQVLFFLNRRGFAPFTQCRQCGTALKCPNCRVSLVFHIAAPALLCHYCGYRIPAPELCPSCKAPALRLCGAGTQRLEGEIRKAFPDKVVLRLDRDTTSGKGSGARLVTDFESGRADILVGTQMVAKGLHFPRLTLVGVISPDILLNLPDFRAAERTFSLVAQVAGRAGRGNRPGLVFVQTWQPEHYALQEAVTHDYDSFYRQEIRFRAELDYPPFFDLVVLRLDGPNHDLLYRVADDVGLRLRDLLIRETEDESCRILGPVPAPLEKIRNRWRVQILVKTRPLEAATGPLRRTAGQLREIAQRKRVHLLIDVSPLHLM